MAKTKTKKPTTTTTLSPAQQTLDQYGGVGAGLGTSTGLGLAPVAGATATPNVTKALASDIVPFTLPGQGSEFTPVAGTTAKSATGGTQMTYQGFVNSIHQLQGQDLINVQHLLHEGGYYTSKAWASYGTLDAATIHAWEQLGQDAIGSPFSATSLLRAKVSDPNLIADLQAAQSKLNTAREQAASATNSNVTLTDPNEVAQRFQSAMQSIGAGPPTQAQTQQFVNAFINGPQGEIAATQNEADMQKQNWVSGQGQLQNSINQFASGNVTQAQQDQGIVGPVGIATKAQPNLDAEAIAAAKATDPAQYYANSTSYAYGILQKMLSGDMSQPTTPSSPTSLAATGGILTSPMAGAVG